MAKRFLPLALGSLLVLVALQASAASVPRFDTAEIALRSAAIYNAAQGTPNPFDFVVTANVISPSGHRYTVDGFFDGDGLGGSVGNVFKARVYADEIGTWTWSTASTVPGLVQSGSFTCSGTLSGAFGKGPIVPNPAFPQTFMYQFGSPVYLLGKFLDSAAPSNIRYSHTMFSEALTDADRQALLDRHIAMKLNQIDVYLANKGDYGGRVPTTPWVGVAASNDKARFDLARFHLFEQWILKMRSAGIVAHLWFFADDSSFGSLPDADRKRLMRYAMARTSGYVNTMYIVILEWQEALTVAQVDDHGNFLQQWNPWARLVSVHGWTGNFSFPASPWVDYMDIQSGNSANYATIHSLGLKNRALAKKPLLQEEFALGYEDSATRQKAWAAFTAGAAGSGTGAYLANLSTFVSKLHFERMAPADPLALSANAYVLAQSGQTYVVYLYNGGTVQLDLRGTTGTFKVQWFDPRAGTFGAVTTVAGGGTPSFTAPASSDWTLLVTR
jgi:hypothetical protein